MWYSTDGPVWLIASSSFLAAGFLFLGYLSLQGPEAMAWYSDNICDYNDTGDTSDNTYPVFTSGTYSPQLDILGDFPTSNWKHTELDNTHDLWDGLGNPNPGSDLNISHGSHISITTADHTDTINSIQFHPLAGGYLAYTWCTLSGSCERTACDISLNSNESWVSGPEDDKDSPYSVSHYYSHELGHAIGLDHVYGYPDTMNSGGSIGGKTQISGDARRGARYLYPDGSTGTDIAVSSFRWNGPASSSGAAVRVPHSSETTESTVGSTGDSLTRMYCIHNLGTTTKTFIHSDYLLVYRLDNHNRRYFARCLHRRLVSSGLP